METFSNHEMVRAVLTIHSPQETFLINDYAPGRTRNGRTSRVPLGVGIDVNSVLIIGIVWKIFDELAKEVCREVAKGLVAKSKEFFAKLRLPPTRAFTGTGSVREQIEKRLIEEGIPAERAGLIAETIWRTWEEHSGAQP